MMFRLVGTWSCLVYCTCSIATIEALTINSTHLEEKPTLDSSVSRFEQPYIEILRGRDGRDGLPGRDGKDGEAGEKGDKGEHGDTGKKGDPGETGEKGDPGEKGDHGEKGDRGDTGEKGDHGEIGEKGDHGDTGAKGDRGETGDRGDTGEKGEIGEKGDRGEVGEKGAPGLTGDKGNQGDTGPPGPPGPPGPVTAGATYVRWGRTTCPSGLGTEMLYAGRAAGSWFAHRGGGTNLLCLPGNPDYHAVDTPISGRSPLYGVEYHTNVGSLNLVDQNVPCAVCYTPTRGTMVMIPAWTHCPASNWTKEYAGYIMTEYKNHRRIEHVCVDENAEVVPGEARDVNGAMLHHVDVACHAGIQCPPYSATNEITCAVCTK